MSKSLKRVQATLTGAGVATKVLEMSSETRTAQQAADAADCALDQIAKSIIVAGADTGAIYLFITAGGNQVNMTRAAALAGEPLDRADAQAVRSHTGFAIGGVAPIGHLSPVRTFMDHRLMDFPKIYGAAGTPRHIFGISPDKLVEISNSQISDFVSLKK